MRAEHLTVLLALVAGLVGGRSGSPAPAERLRRLGLVAGAAADNDALTRDGVPQPGGAGGRTGPGGHVRRGRRSVSGDRGGSLDRRGTRWSGRAASAAALLLGVSGHGGAAVVTGVFVVALLAPAEVARRRRRARHEALSRDVPRAADLMATCLDAGAAPAAALSVVAGVLEGPLAEVLRSAAAVLALGGPVDGQGGPVTRSGQVGAAVPAGSPDHGSPAAALLSAFSRAASTGAPLASTLRDLAADERERARGLALERARKAGVQAIGPLAVCFLPAFVLVGVLPVVVGVARSLFAAWS